MFARLPTRLKLKTGTVISTVAEDSRAAGLGGGVERSRQSVLRHADTTRSTQLCITGYFGQRIHQHKYGSIEGFTKKYFCSRLVYYESYQDVQVAIAREKQIKR